MMTGRGIIFIWSAEYDKLMKMLIYTLKYGEKVYFATSFDLNYIYEKVYVHRLYVCSSVYDVL